MVIDKTEHFVNLSTGSLRELKTDLLGSGTWVEMYEVAVFTANKTGGDGLSAGSSDMKEGGKKLAASTVKRGNEASAAGQLRGAAGASATPARGKVVGVSAHTQHGHEVAQRCPRSRAERRQASSVKVRVQHAPRPSKARLLHPADRGQGTSPHHGAHRHARYLKGSA